MHQILYPCSAGPSGRGRGAWLSPSAPISHSSPCSPQSSWPESPSTAGHSKPRYHPLIWGLRGTPVAQEPTLLQSLKTDRARDGVRERLRKTTAYINDQIHANLIPPRVKDNFREREPAKSRANARKLKCVRKRFSFTLLIWKTVCHVKPQPQPQSRDVQNRLARESLAHINTNRTCVMCQERWQKHTRGLLITARQCEGSLFNSHPVIMQTLYANAGVEITCWVLR